MLSSKHERVLAMDGEYIHIMAPEDKQRFFEHVRAVISILKSARITKDALTWGAMQISFHISNVVSCKVFKKQASSIRIQVNRGDGESYGTKTYDIDAANATEAGKLAMRTNMRLFPYPISEQRKSSTA